MVVLSHQEAFSVSISSSMYFRVLNGMSLLYISHLKLSKKDFMWLMQIGCSVAFRHLEICGAWDTIAGIIDELDMRQAFIKDGNELKEPRAAYL